MIPSTVEGLDAAAEWLQLSERYRRMSDGELLVLAQQNSELTEIAQQCLVSETSRRGLKLQPEELPATPYPSPPFDSSGDEDRELVEICTVWSLSDALQVQTLLDRAGIPFFMGPEKATGVEAVTSNFVHGVSVQVMRIGLPWTRQPLSNYMPVNEPGPKQEAELDELPVRCPKCHSTEVIFEGLIAVPTPTTDHSSRQYEWTCDSCGHQWKDDGIAKEE
jgi:DNA-directed RNA polymerase subunit M/transcription elongation factor TFIIS